MGVEERKGFELMTDQPDWIAAAQGCFISLFHICSLVYITAEPACEVCSHMTASKLKFLPIRSESHTVTNPYSDNALSWP